MKRTRLNRSLVIAAAAHLADEEGVEAVTPRRVAAALGCRMNALYNHVDGAEGLIHGIAILAVKELGDMLWEAGMGRSGRDAIQALAYTYRDFIARYPQRFRAAIQTRIYDDELRAENIRCNKAIQTVIATYRLSRDQIEHSSRVFTSSLMGFCAVFDRAIPDPMNPPVSDTFDIIVDIVCHYIERTEEREAQQARPA